MKILFAVGVVAFVVFLLWKLPVITGRGVKAVRTALAEIQPVELSGKTLFISDLHLTAKPALNEQFNLDFSDVQNVVIVGDFFNQPEDFESFGSSEEERLRKVLSHIVPANFSGKMFYIHATTHDPQNLTATQLSFENYEFFYIGEYGKFLVNGVPVVAYHGHQLHWGILGGGITWLAEKFGIVLPFEKLGKERFGIDKNTWVINGHSHVPGVDQEARVANTGSFVGVPFNTLIFKIHVGTGVLFDGGEVEFQEYEGLNIKKLYPFSF